MTKEYLDELDKLMMDAVSGKTEATEAPVNRKQTRSKLKAADEEEKIPFDSSIVKEEETDTEFPHQPLPEYDLTIKQESDSMDDDGSSDEDVKPIFDSDSDERQSSNETADRAVLTTDAGDVQPVAKRRKKKRTKQNEGSDIDGETNEAIATSRKKPIDDEDAKPRKGKRIGGQIRKRRRERAYANLADEHITQAGSRNEQELMSLVFGGKTEIVSQLDKGGKKTDHARKGKNAQDKLPVAPSDDRTEPRSAAWQDSDDEREEDGSNNKRYKHNRDGEQLTYERRRKQFEQIVGNPKWAELDREREPSDSEDEMLRKVGHVVKATASRDLPKGVIELKKLKNLNRETKHEGDITSINFHPTSMVAMMAGKGGMVSIVAVDGVRNEKLHTIALEKFRISCACLSPDGNEAVFGSYRKFYHVYDLISGESHSLRIPPNENWCMSMFRFSGCGKYIATVGIFGEVHVLNARGKELLWTIQMRYRCMAIAFTPDSRYLLCHSNDTEVTVYSVEKRRIVNVFHDEGCVSGSAIAVCPNGQFVATGTRQGVVNIYSLDVTLEKKYPVPVKTINNLTTYIDTLTFNATSELLAMASSSLGSAIKLVHVKSGTVFKNFPHQMANLGKISRVQFSPSGGFLAIGNKKGVVSLFRVKHYENY